MGHFIKHLVGSEPRTHRGGGKAAVRALLKASAVGVQAWRRRGTAGIMDEEQGHGRHGAPAWGGGRRGAVLRRGVVLRRRGGRGWRGVEMNWDNFNPRHFYSSSSSLPVLLVNRQ